MPYINLFIISLPQFMISQGGEQQMKLYCATINVWSDDKSTSSTNTFDIHMSNITTFILSSQFQRIEKCLGDTTRGLEALQLSGSVEDISAQ